MTEPCPLCGKDAEVTTFPEGSAFSKLISCPCVPADFPVFVSHFVTPADSYLGAMRAKLAETAEHFRKVHAVYCRGESCRFCHPQPDECGQFECSGCGTLVNRFPCSQCGAES